MLKKYHDAAATIISNNIWISWSIEEYDIVLDL
jgi:hypothetical protein